ncbi:non-specific serine/threonine protein kinase [Frankia sp. AiPs1]|uniref:serine/threonine-protein kinase n=1 Tax=Frankia sp. AiPa1 TaxID=573492 RepID=UPI00202AFB86|nr:serine/threonine-protein kinase [Frankia sp. AiPa1]MCL9762717.1 serine/threonine protein kinase [Frankia sp. AiPa1]
MGLLHEGQIIRDTYRVERLLGTGAFAEVYRVAHRYLGRQAMKVFRQTDMSAEQVRDALGEALLLTSMGHPNVIRVFEANTLDTPGGTYAYFTMEYVAGGTVRSFWSSHGDALVPIPTAVEIIRQAASGLAVAHGASPPIVHRDITPYNILVGYKGADLQVRVSDFGLAKKVSALTLLASSQGTVAFMAPETLLHPHLASVPGDVWSLGAVFYQLLTDQLPYPRRATGDPVQAAWNTGTLVPPSVLRYEVDAALDEIVGRALSYDAARRYPSATELLADLTRWRPRQASSGQRAGPPEPVPAGEVLAGKSSRARHREVRT